MYMYLQVHFSSIWLERHFASTKVYDLYVELVHVRGQQSLMFMVHVQMKVSGTAGTKF